MRFPRGPLGELDGHENGVCVVGREDLDQRVAPPRILGWAWKDCERIPNGIRDFLKRLTVSTEPVNFADEWP
jgi:hypothetical protein